MTPILTIEIADPEERLTPETLRWLAQTADRAVKVLGGTGEVRVKLVGDAEMTQAHAEFMDIAETTDVLTFDMSENLSDVDDGDQSPAIALTPSGEVIVRKRVGLDVDILACVDEAQRQVKTRGHAVEREVLLYIVHGVLHCLGFDDHDAEAAALMHRVEDAVLSAVGVGPVFHSVGPTGSSGA
ncbi:MAG: rRNA maturation RNase YbeY [Phycisphaerales bacterium]|nr:MAG: rRNA maturation RNase YbeY [Phycisphaerales bacterium]